MKHTTKRALVHLAGGDYHTEEAAVLACDNSYGDYEELVGVEAIMYHSTDLPDCPRCAVLWDQAIEAKQ